ncbi:MAG: hypothetical protein E7243_01515 [Lacrimispora celerecrescens]|nr:hypothetical protein [Lacrimispora celerecrescens]
MANQTNLKFKDSTIAIEENTIRWEDHIIKTENISHIWIGNCPDKPFPVRFVLILLLIALSGTSPGSIIGVLLALILYPAAWIYWERKQKEFKGIHFETGSGKIYSFLCNNEEFTYQAYELISDLISKNSADSNLQISFVGDGKITDDSEAAKEPAPSSQVLNIMNSRLNEKVLNELQKLSMYYNQHNEINNEALNLIDKAVQSLNSNDKQGTKNSFGGFITMGLINDCNELGLNALIDEIKANIY